jgi:acyl carrier protein
MDYSEIRSKLVELLALAFDCRPVDITDKDSFKSLGGDSMEFIEYVMTVEETFGIDLEDAATRLKSKTTLHDAVLIVQSQVQG